MNPANRPGGCFVVPTIDDAPRIDSRWKAVLGAMPTP
jgi:hypothetical protein